MAKLTRQNLKVFAGNSANIGQFGSGQLGTKNLTTDIEEIQDLSAYENGWDDAVISGNRLPPLEEMNAVQHVSGYQTAYLLQEGIPEYNVDTEYYTNSIVKKSTTTELWSSLVDSNLGNSLVEGVNWTLLGDLADLINASNPPLPTKFIEGLVPKNDITDPDHDVEFGVGKCRSQDDTSNITREIPIIKKIDTSWASGNNQGGLASSLSLLPNTWYWTFEIYNPLTESNDAGFDTDANATNLLADATGYTEYRRTGFVYTDGSSNIIKMNWMEQAGGSLDVLFENGIDVYNASPGTSYTNVTAITPPVDCIANIHFFQGLLSAAGLVTVYIETDYTTDFEAGKIEESFAPGGNNFKVQIGSNQLIGIRKSGSASQSGVTILTCVGYTDMRIS